MRSLPNRQTALKAPVNFLYADRRAAYVGAIGCDGKMETCVMLRTALLEHRHVHDQTGGGWLGDPNSADECEEIINKASSVFNVVAREGLNQSSSRGAERRGDLVGVFESMTWIASLRSQ